MATTYQTSKRNPYFEESEQMLDDDTQFDLSQLTPKQISLLGRSGRTDSVVPRGLGSSYSQREASLLEQAGQQAGAGKIAVPNVQQVNKYNLDPRSMGGDFDRLQESLAAEKKDFKNEGPDPSEGDTTFSSEGLVAPDYPTPHFDETGKTLGKGYLGKVAAGLALTGTLLPALTPAAILLALFGFGRAASKDKEVANKQAQLQSLFDPMMNPDIPKSNPLGLPTHALDLSLSGSYSGVYDTVNQKDLSTFTSMPGFGSYDYDANSDDGHVSGHGADYDYDSTGYSGYY